MAELFPARPRTHPSPAPPAHVRRGECWSSRARKNRLGGRSRSAVSAWSRRCPTRSKAFRVHAPAVSENLAEWPARRKVRKRYSVPEAQWMRRVAARQVALSRLERVAESHQERH